MLDTPLNLYPLEKLLPRTKFADNTRPDKEVPTESYILLDKYAHYEYLSLEVLNSLIFNNRNLLKAPYAKPSDGYIGMAAWYLGRYFRYHHYTDAFETKGYGPYVVPDPMWAVLWCANMSLNPEGNPKDYCPDFIKESFLPFMQTMSLSDDCPEYDLPENTILELDIPDRLYDLVRIWYAQHIDTCHLQRTRFYTLTTAPSIEDFAKKVCDEVSSHWKEKDKSVDADYAGEQMTILDTAILTFFDVATVGFASSMEKLGNGHVDILTMHWKRTHLYSEMRSFMNRFTNHAPIDVLYNVNYLADRLIGITLGDLNMIDEYVDPEADNAVKAYGINRTPGDQIVNELCGGYQKLHANHNIKQDFLKVYISEYLHFRVEFGQGEFTDDESRKIIELAQLIQGLDLEQPASNYEYGKAERVLENYLVAFEAKDTSYTEKETKYQEANGSKIGRDISKAYKTAMDNKEKISLTVGKVIKAVKNWLVGTEEEEIDLVLEGKRFSVVGVIKRLLVGVAIFHFSEIAGICALILLWAANKKVHETSKQKMMHMLKEELTMIDEKIQDAQSDGDRKAKYALMRSKNQLENAYMRLKWNVGAKLNDDEAEAVRTVKKRAASNGELHAEDSRLRVANVNMRGIHATRKVNNR